MSWISVAEKGRVTQISLRRRLRSGGNLDLVTGTDLCDPAETKALWAYLRDYKPLVVIMGPPCTPYGPWSNLNWRLNREGWQRSYDACSPIARLCGAVALFQLRAGRHFLRENPHPPYMNAEAPWPEVMRHPNVVYFVFDQCMVGLRSQSRMLIKKPTGLVAPSYLLVQDF